MQWFSTCVPQNFLKHLFFAPQPFFLKNTTFRDENKEIRDRFKDVFLDNTPF